MAIPKIIHYVWVGKSEKTRNVLKCIKSWQKKCKDYKFIEWNEENFDINSNNYTKMAYEQKKWAFVSDYIRMYALQKYGGIYMDTDVITVDNFDKLLDNQAFIGFENNKYISGAVIGAEANHPLINDILEYYNSIKANASFSFIDNNSILITNILKNKYGCILNNNTQLIKQNVQVYNDGILSNPSKQSVSIHLFEGTWLKNSDCKAKICKYIKYHISNKYMAEVYNILIRKRGKIENG